MFQTESSFLVATRGTSQDRRDDENERHSFFLRYIYFVQISEVTFQLTAHLSSREAEWCETVGRDGLGTREQLTRGEVDLKNMP